MAKKIAIVGNGSIGLISAIQIKSSFPESQVDVFGFANKPFAGSTAAGAMAAVYAEVEKSFGSSQEINERYLQMGKIGATKWKQFLHSTGGHNCITSRDTYVYLQNNPTNFETSNFETVIEYAEQDKVVVELKKADIDYIFPQVAQSKISRAIKLDGEFTFSPNLLFSHLEKIAQDLGINLINEDVEIVDASKMRVHFNNQNITYDKIVLSAGVKSQQLLHEANMMQIFQGVGVAILINPVRNIEFDKLRKGAFRSVNRGGAQCGIHVVPREDGKFYLGAGNFVSKVETPQIRLDTVSYLLSIFEHDLIGRELAYNLTGQFVLGTRPRSLDGFPMLGPISTQPNIFVASGTNRLGLTWAPFIADQIVNWISEKNLSDLISGWEPDRNPIKFGDINQGIQYFVSSRISNAIEHKLLGRESDLETREQKETELRNAAHQMAKSVSERLNLKFNETVNPDNWSSILSS